MTVDPLVIEFEIAAPPARAFDAWTRQCATWWPPSHTISGDPAAITFEPRSGGRIVELAPDGGEHHSYRDPPRAARVGGARTGRPPPARAHQ